MANDTDVLEALGVLSAAYPRYDLTDQTIAVYTRMLADLPADILRMAALECASKRTFFPSVHELRQAATVLDMRANGVPSAAEAWQELVEAPADWVVRHHEEVDGRWHIYNEPYQFSHPIVEKVARNLGAPEKFWSGNLAADRSRFMDAFEVEIRRNAEEALSVPEVRGYVKERQLEAGEKIRQLAAKLRSV